MSEVIQRKEASSPKQPVWSAEKVSDRRRDQEVSKRVFKVFKAKTVSKVKPQLLMYPWMYLHLTDVNLFVHLINSIHSACM